MRRVLTFILAGGRGERLDPLTRDRTKPAVPFGGIYRIIDFTLSNSINSGLRRIYVLTQYKSFSLQKHLLSGWDIVSTQLGEFIDVIPAQQRIGEDWYRGTADAIYQNIYAAIVARLDTFAAEHASLRPLLRRLGAVAHAYDIEHAVDHRFGICIAQARGRRYRTRRKTRAAARTGIEHVAYAARKRGFESGIIHWIIVTRNCRSREDSSGEWATSFRDRGRGLFDHALGCPIELGEQIVDGLRANR